MNCGVGDGGARELAVPRAQLQHMAEREAAAAEARGNALAVDAALLGYSSAARLGWPRLPPLS